MLGFHVAKVRARGRAGRRMLDQVDRRLVAAAVLATSAERYSAEANRLFDQAHAGAVRLRELLPDLRRHAAEAVASVKSLIAAQDERDAAEAQEVLDQLRGPQLRGTLIGALLTDGPLVADLQALRAQQDVARAAFDHYCSEKNAALATRARAFASLERIRAKLSVLRDKIERAEAPGPRARAPSPVRGRKTPSGRPSRQPRPTRWTASRTAATT